MSASFNKAMGVAPMSNYDIIDEMLNDKSFIGVFNRDDLPANMEHGTSLILNLDSSAGPGTHWVAVVYFSDHIEYFDSYGLAPPIEVLVMMENSHEVKLYNTSQIQALGTPICGYYCIHYIKRRKHKSMYDVLYGFKQLKPMSKESNYEVIKKYIV